MKPQILQAILGSSSIILGAQASHVTFVHWRKQIEYARRHTHDGKDESLALGKLKSPETAKRSTCSLPDDPDLHYVPGASNAGFAMSPNQPCVDGRYCPIACRPGMVMAQWKEGISYTFPDSMDGGLLCKGGKVVKPFPEAPYCVKGAGSVQVVNKCGKTVAFCQTVLPGNEAMLIPTSVDSNATLAVPGPDYWLSNAAHYYINPPGYSTEVACVWGESSTPVGNWAPYVAGANQDADGSTFVKIGWNPVWTDSALSKTTPSFGLRIECPDGNCIGFECEINPAKYGTGVVKSPVSAVGAGGASFCVVTVAKGSTANIVVFNTDGSSEVGNISPPPSPLPPPPSAPPPPMPTPSLQPTPMLLTPSEKSTISETVTSTFTSLSSLSSTSSICQKNTLTLPSSESTSTAILEISLTMPAPASHGTLPTGGLGAIYHENSTHGSGLPKNSPEPTAPVPTSSKSEGTTEQGGAAIAGLIVAFVAAAALY